ncbi:uncharacterized protein LOC127578582 [Pristis pectinata]|uniref:uncharacterized protein LOC127578582 n=1 Tax=Pristis pectinata TaxID=685728 RepID=UPI00223CBE52|nr:uncharacterized protein LOC127578582 [Pristis pectinata]
MNTSSGSLQLPWNFTRRPRTLYPGAMDPESCTSTREIWKSAAHSKHPARWYCRLQFKPSSKPQPKSSPPSEVSSGEDEVKLCAGHRKTPPGTSEQNPAEVSGAHRGHASSEEFWSDAELGDPGMEEVDVLGESFSPLQSRMENTTSHDSGQALNVSSQGCGFSLDRDNNETDAWDRQPSSGTGSSTDLSQLCCSSFSWNSRTSTGSKMQAGSSAQPDRTHLRNASPLAVSSLYQSSVNLDQSACGRHSTSDPLHMSSCAARESPAERTLSFVEIWHDRLLKHWPVLPPISPQTGSLEACSYGSDSGAMHSYSELSAYEELDEIIPCTGSSLSHHILGDTAEEMSESDLTGRSPVSQTPSTSAADRTLAEARLALLDHQGFDQGRDINLLEELLAQATIAESMESMARGEREVEGGRSKINGSLSPCPPDNLSERKPAPTQRPNKDDVDLDCNTTNTDWSCKAAPLSRAIPSPGGTRRQCSTPVKPEPRTTALPEKVNSSEVTPSPNEEGQGSPTPPVGEAVAVGSAGSSM